MNNFDLAVESVLEDKDLLEEKLEDLIAIFGQPIAVDIWRYFQCRQGKSVGGECPSADRVFAKIANWFKTSNNTPQKQDVEDLISMSNNTPETFLANLYHKFVYNQ